ncbi:response regulator [Blautia schinkii]|nr:response regulator [Blautia schinkii]
MYQVAVVEDQVFIAKTIADMIQKESEDFEICGIYYDGKELLDNLKENPPDIVITDIKMPQMDGLALSAHLVNKYPDIKIIILSGYEDFQYAREAIRLGVCNYLLKPCSVNELMETLEKVAEKISQEKKRDVMLHEYEEFFIDNLPTLRQQALISLMFTQASAIQTQKLRLEHLEGPCQLFLIIPQLKYQDSAEEELLLFCCMNIFEELLEPINGKELFICNHQFVLIAPMDKSLSSKNKICVQKACSRIETIIHHKVIFYEGKEMAGISECRESYQSALEQSAQTVFLDNGEVREDSESVLDKAIQFIQKNYAHDISLQDVADAAYVSYNYLSTLFTQNLGVNFSVYLSRIRVEKACALLKHPESRVADVAELVGYSNYRYFNHVFKKLTGYTPSEYRRTQDKRPAQ